MQRRLRRVETRLGRQLVQRSATGSTEPTPAGFVLPYRLYAIHHLVRSTAVAQSSGGAATMHT